MTDATTALALPFTMVRGQDHRGFAVDATRRQAIDKLAITAIEVFDFAIIECAQLLLAGISRRHALHLQQRFVAHAVLE